jgi:hypothetical protein
MLGVSVETSGSQTVTDQKLDVKIARNAARWGLLVLALLAGAAVGFFGAFSHRDQAVWLGITWPVGLFYVFAGMTGLFLALAELPPLPGAWRPGRLGASGTAGFGWLVALLAVTYLGPPPSFALKGDVILANDWISMTYLIGGMALVTTAVYRSWLAVLDEKLAARRR